MVGSKIDPRTKAVGQIFQSTLTVWTHPSVKPLLKNATSTLMWRCYMSTKHHWEPPISAVCCEEKVMMSVLGISLRLSIKVKRCEWISPVEDKAESRCGGFLQVRWPHNNRSRTPLNRKRGKTQGGREGEVELLCNNNMVLKSKYQALATSAEIQRKKKRRAERRGYVKQARGS